MPLLGTLIKKAYQIKDRPALREAKVSPIEMQYKELKKLLSKAEITAFGGRKNECRTINRSPYNDENKWHVFPKLFCYKIFGNFASKFIIHRIHSPAPLKT